MKKLKDFLIGLLFLVIVCSLIFFVYQRVTTRHNRELARRMLELSPRGGPPESIEGLRRAIALYEDQIERNVMEGAQTGVYWKILGTRLADRDMDNDAIEAFERAVYYNTEDAALYYLTGISAAKVAKSKVGFSANAERERQHFYTLAENSHLRALELDATYTRPMYALGVLYAFELDRPDDAITQLERFLQIQTSDINAMAVLARAFFMTGNFRRAIEQYERIIDRTRDQNIRQEAMNNIEFIQRTMYE